MVTVIHQSDSLKNAVNYNEQKLKQGKAECLLAVNYPKDPEELNFYQKLHLLTNQAALRPRTKVNSVHISINFDPSEKLSPDELKAVAQSYMERIGFGKQPYLVYEHRDAGHPHLHVVTTNITAEGKRIELHNLGRNQSEQARKAVEKEFGLITAQQQGKKAQTELKVAAIQNVVYGRSETKRAIQNVLEVALARYKFTSLEELNAVLRTANVKASRGQAGSRTHDHGGLIYQVLGEDGKPVGVPIKASAFYSKPTLPKLQEKFEENSANRAALEKRVRLAIDWYFLKTRSPSREGLQKVLTKEGIETVEYAAKDGRVFGVTFIDHVSGGVFKGSDLGKEYSAQGMTRRMETVPEQGEVPSLPERQQKPAPSLPKRPADSTDELGPRHMPVRESGSVNPTDGPNHPEPHVGLPAELRENEKKRRRRKRLRL